MKRSTKLMLILTFSLTTTSCNDSDIIIENSNVSNTIPAKESLQNHLTSDEALYKAQSDFENMLMDQIIYRDSVYVLNMSKEEAIDLTIPDSLYASYLKIVNDLNAQQ